MYYKGCYGTIGFTKVGHVFYGRIKDIPTVVSYKSHSAFELEAAFRKAVNKYLTQTGAEAGVDK